MSYDTVTVILERVHTRASAMRARQTNAKKITSKSFEAAKEPLGLTALFVNACWGEEKKRLRRPPLDMRPAPAMAAPGDLGRGADSARGQPEAGKGMIHSAIQSSPNESYLI